MKLVNLAKDNLLVLKENPYPGRGIITGMDETGKFFVQVYWVMGRSKNSRNRVFVQEKNSLLKTAPADPTKVEDPSLIIYTAMDQSGGGQFAVSNGAQTTEASIGYEGAMKRWIYEPDKPNYTPRITALSEIYSKEGPFWTKMSILKKSPFGNFCDRYSYNLETHPGLGYCITTYSGDGNPLPAFQGDPYLLPLIGNIGDISKMIWNNLNEENRVSLAVKFINIETKKTVIRIINKFKQV